MNAKSPVTLAEQIRNGDFSDGSQGWQSFDDVNFDNERCNLGVGGIATQVLSNVPAGRYRLACRAAVVTAGAFPRSRIRLSYGTTDIIIDILSTTPQDYTTDLDVPSGIGNMTVYLEGNTGAVWFDDISLNFAPQNDELLQNGDFSEGSAHWDLTGSSFDAQTCVLRMDDVSQTVAVPVLGYYELKARARVVKAGTVGRLQATLPPATNAFYMTINSQEWTEYSVNVPAISGESHIKVSLIRNLGEELEFDDVSLRLVSGVDS